MYFKVHLQLVSSTLPIPLIFTFWEKNGDGDWGLIGCPSSTLSNMGNLVKCLSLVFHPLQLAFEGEQYGEG